MSGKLPTAMSAIPLLDYALERQALTQSVRVRGISWRVAWISPHSVRSYTQCTARRIKARHPRSLGGLNKRGF